MTTGVSEFGARTLDFTGDSIQLVTRKGADLIWIHRFEDENGAPLPVNNWVFRTMAGDSLGAVRNGVDANGMPVTVDIDIKAIDTESTEASYGIGQGSYSATTNVLELSFDMGAQPASLPPNRFFQIVLGFQTFNFQSSDVTDSSGPWLISIDPAAGNTDENATSGGYTLNQRPHAFGVEDAIQCYFRTRALSSINPSSGRSNNAPFEIEADIPTGTLTDSQGNMITVRQVIASGVITVFSDVFDAPAP